MTTYSDWIIIPKNDRKCFLTRDAKVQIMWRNEDAEYAEKNNAIESASKYTDIGGWFTNIFAYRYVIEPVEEVREYTCAALFYINASPSFYFHSKPKGMTKGTATQTTRDGKPYEFHWRADE